VTTFVSQWPVVTVKASVCAKNLRIKFLYFCFKAVALQLRETDSSVVFIIFAVLLGKIGSIACLDHTRRAFGGLYHCAKFGWNRCSRFDNMQVLIFCKLGLKTLIHAAKCRFWGFDSLNGELSHRDHPKALPCTETRHVTYWSSKLVHWCGLNANRRTK